MVTLTMAGVIMAVINGIITGASVSFGAWLISRGVIRHLDAEKQVKKND